MSFPGWSTDLHISPIISTSSQQHSSRCTWFNRLSSTNPEEGTQAYTVTQLQLKVATNTIKEADQQRKLTFFIEKIKSIRMVGLTTLKRTDLLCHTRKQPTRQQFSKTGTTLRGFYNRDPKYPLIPVYVFLLLLLRIGIRFKYNKFGRRHTSY